MYEKEIKPHRKTIDKLNDEIIEILAQRLEAALAIGEIKKKYGKPVVDKSREKAILEQIKRKADEKGINPDSMERVFKEIIRYCVTAEEKQ
jgi:chorismate mutase